MTREPWSTGRSHCGNVCTAKRSALRACGPSSCPLWQAVGRELARLHLRIQECADPEGYLDDPERDQDVGAALQRLVDAKTLDIDAARGIERLAEELRPYGADALETRFIHDDIHPVNIMCSTDGELLAIIDWGDAGWGDPSLDFASIPFSAIQPALEGHEAEAPGLLGPRPDTVDDLWDSPAALPDAAAFRRLARLRIS